MTNKLEIGRKTVHLASKVSQHTADSLISYCDKTGANTSAVIRLALIQFLERFENESGN